MRQINRPIFVLLFSVIQLSVFAQTREQVFEKIQKLLDKAVGEKVKGFSNEEKITKQVFTPTLVSCNKKGLSKYGSEWVNRYTNISWNDFFEHFIYDATSDGKLQEIKLRFKKDFKSEFFTSDKAGDDDPSQYNVMELYIREKDKDEADKYFKLLYQFKEKKPESALNAQIRKFTKDQTLTWLRDKMNQYVEGGQFDNGFKIVIDECKMTINYSGLVRKYEAVLPTNIKSINKYGGFEYDSKIASIRTTTPDMIDDGKTSYNTSSPVGISNRDEEVMENIEVAFKHLASFCGKTSSVSSSSQYIVQESFYNNNLKWFEEENSDYKFKVSGGSYNIQSKKGNSWFATLPFTNFNSSKDFEITTNFKKTAGTDGYYFGMVLGYNTSSRYFHFAGITGQGNAVFANKGNAPADLVGGNIYYAVRKGNATNKLTVKKNNGMIKLYVNDLLVGETKSQSFFGNYFGFQLWSGSSNLSIEVEDFAIRYLN